MDRKIIYPGAIPLENDLLETNRFAMIGLAKLAGTIMGTSTYLNGIACLPTSPASMAVTVGAGEIYSLQNVDDTAYSSMPADTTHSILKQGILPDTTALALQAPSTSGFSQNYLIEVTFEESDTENTVLPYYNASNPTQAWHGPNNSGSAQGTVRQGMCVVKAKAGIAATTGTQSTPGPDAGYIAAYIVTIAAGQTSISTGNITRVEGAPFLPAGGLVDGMQTGAMNYAVDHGATNAYAASFMPPVKALVDGMTLTFRAANANTGASTFSPNGLAAAPLYSNTNTPLTGGEILVSAQVEIIWNSALSAWVLTNTNMSALSKGFVKTVNEHEPDQYGNVKLGTAADVDITTSTSDPTQGRVTRVGDGGLLGTGLSVTDDNLADKSGLVSMLFSQGGGSVNNHFGAYGSGVHLMYGDSGDGTQTLSANLFVDLSGNLSVEWLAISKSDGSVKSQHLQKLFGPLNPPTAAQTNAMPYFGTALSVDLNTLGAYSAAGVHYQPTNAGATTANHYPVTEAGALLVLPSAYGCQQEYTTFGTGRKFLRGLNGAWNGTNGPWGNWNELYGPTNPNEIVSPSANSYRIAYNGYGTFWRNDGINFYLMLTNSGDPHGNYNALRPFRVNVATGEAVMHKLNLEDFSYFDARYKQTLSLADTGAVGTLAMLCHDTALGLGATAAGSSLYYSGFGAQKDSYGDHATVGRLTSPQPAGTWKCMGIVPAPNNNDRGASLFCRIA